MSSDRNMETSRISAPVPGADAGGAGANIREPLSAIMPPEQEPESSSSRNNNIPQPRQPTSLQGLLRFVTETARNEHTFSANNPPMPMDEERKKFLEEVVNALTIDITAEMTKSIEILSDANKISKILCDSEVPLDVSGAFDLLMDAIYNIDTSIGFYKLNGYSIFPICFGCENSKVRELSCKVLAELCQNNPFCQSTALECGFLQTILAMLKSETEEKALQAALYATSCMVREHKQCTEVFVSEGGYSALARCISQPFIRIQDKASFLISVIYPMYPDTQRDEVIEVVKNMAIALKHSTVDQHPRQVIIGLQAIISSADKSLIRDCISPDTELKESCETYLNFVKLDSDTNREEIYNCEKVLNVINASVSNKPRKQSDQGLDR